MINTKSGVIYEPTTPVSQAVYYWLKRHQHTLDGSRAYEEMVELYEVLEYDFGRKSKKEVV